MKNKTTFLCVLLLSICCHLTYADNDNADDYQSSLRIISPKEFSREWAGEIRNWGAVAVGNFGYVPWGRTLVGNLKLAIPDDGCKYEWSENKGNSSYDEEDDAPILVTERGGCTFTVKALKAQLQGAKMLIVIDNKDEYTAGIIPIGDGNEKGVHIPTILISKTAGEKLKAVMKKTTKTNDQRDVPTVVTAAMFFDFPRRAKIDYELWLSPVDRKSFDFVRDLAAYIPRLGSNTTFKPYYTTWASYSPDSDYTKLHCISKGNYCAPDPDSYGPLSGKDTLEESMRQLCIWTIDPAKWWSYHQNFDTLQLNDPRMHEQSNTTIRAIGLSPDKIAECVSKSFETPGDRTTDTTLLKANLEKYYTRGIPYWPAVVVNNFTYRGGVEAREVFEFLCEGFADGKIPVGCFEDTNISGGGSRKKSGGVIGPLFTLVVVLAIFGLIFVLYKRWLTKNLRRELNTQMNVRISQYFSMADLGGK